MNNFVELKRKLSRIEQLEKELNLKQVQITRLLSITQAINNNVSAKELFDMYKSFLSYEMGIKKMGLYVQSGNMWLCTSSIGMDAKLLQMDIRHLLKNYTSMDRLSDSEHPLISQFDIVITVSHKDSPIAYVFLGGFEEEDDMYDKVQFITTLTNVIAVAIENKRLFKRQIEQEKLRREMELASSMQRSLVPKHLPSKDCYELDSIYQPHLSVGGDYFDFMEFGDGRIVFCIGDISGKGLAAALLMANFHGIFRTLVDKQSKMRNFVRDVNQALFRITNGERHMTFFVAEYDMHTKKLRYVNAGHNPPILVQQGKAYMLNEGTTILGAFEELPFLEIGKVKIEEEAMVLIYTDGLTDIQDQQGNYLDLNFLEQFVKDRYKLTAKSFNKELVEMANQFIGEQQDYPDDLTVLTCKLFTPAEVIC